MTMHLPKDVERSIEDAVQSGHFASADDAVAAAWRAFERLEQGQSQQRADQSESAIVKFVPVWKRVLDNMQAVPDEVFERIPADCSERLDHYLYGTPKRPTR
jgi:Arc/MetJ-type ribon-helix-helix transcriptional regulator